MKTKSMKVEGRYDVRQGAAGYAPIVGAFGALAVPAIIVLFTVPPAPTARTTPFIALAAGLLTVALIGSLTSSIGLAAIGAEQDATANLPPAIMYMSIPVVLSIVAVLAAFEALAAIYLPESKTLFALIAGAAGLSGVFFTAFAIGDSWHTGPTDANDRMRWLPTQWLQSHTQAYKAAVVVAGVSAVPALLGMILRLSGVAVAPTAAGMNWLIGFGFVLAMAGTFLGVARTAHPVNGVQKGLRCYEALGTTLATSLYVLVLMMFLP